MRTLIIIFIIATILIFGWISGRKYIFPVKTVSEPRNTLPLKRSKGGRILDWMYASSSPPSEEMIKEMLVEFHRKITDRDIKGREDPLVNRHLNVYYEVYSTAYPFQCISSTFRPERKGLTPEMIQSMEKTEPGQTPDDYASTVRDWSLRLQMNHGVPYFDVKTMRFPLELGEHVAYSYISYEPEKKGKYNKSRMFRIFVLKK